MMVKVIEIASKIWIELFSRIFIKKFSEYQTYFKIIHANVIDIKSQVIEESKLKYIS